MNKEVETELKAKLKQLPMPEKIKCCALYSHLKEVYAAQTDCDNKNRKIIFDFQNSHGHLLNEVTAIANGRELTDADLEGKEEFFTPEELEAKEYLTTAPLDSFYLNVLKKGPSIAEFIKSHDEPILKHLTGIENVMFEDKDDYKLNFTFSENEFFSNEVLSVHVVVNEEDGEATEIKSDKIDWKEGKNVTEKTITKKQKNKRTGQNRTVTKTQKQESFFVIFQDRKDSDEDEDDEDREDDEDAFDSFPMVEEIIAMIKENVVPYVGASYFGVEIPELEMEADCCDEEFEDDDDEEDTDASKGKKKGKKSCCDPKKEECKQN